MASFRATNVPRLYCCVDRRHSHKQTKGDPNLIRVSLQNVSLYKLTSQIKCKQKGAKTSLDKISILNFIAHTIKTNTTNRAGVRDPSVEVSLTILKTETDTHTRVPIESVPD